MIQNVFKKAEQSEDRTQRSIVMALWNPAGGDSSELLEKLMPLLRKNGESMAIVEFPCVGIPRVAYRFGLEEVPANQTIDQLLIDVDRGMLEPFHSYLLPHEGADCLIIQPRSKADAPVLLKLQQESTLIELPSFLKNQLSSYDWVFFVLQGQLIHPMTFFALRASDSVVLLAKEAMEWIRMAGTYTLLKNDYGFRQDQLIMFTGMRRSLLRKQTKNDMNLIVHPAELLKQGRAMV